MTPEAGRNWLRAQGRGVEDNVWGAAWHAASGTGKRVQRRGVPRGELGGWVVRAQKEGKATTAKEGLNWLRAQGRGVGDKAWREAWRGVVEAGVAHLEVTGGGHSGGSRPALSGSEGFVGAGDLVGLGEMWAGPSDDPVGRRVLGDWSADFADDEDPFMWERGVGEGDVAGALGLAPVDSSEWGSGEVYPGESQAGPSTLQPAAHPASGGDGAVASGQQDPDTGQEKRARRRGIPWGELGGWVVRAQTEGGATTAEEGRKWLHAQNRGVGDKAWAEAWRAASGTGKRARRPGIALGSWVGGLCGLKPREGPRRLRQD
ncbi:hypothetical protein [Saccharopolyspora spinosa]|uniref:hypothetical protein n=1 Tax=Saccharopolyspora spinosa TaxID=60894 RepID=UPI001659B273|nr:hypothetical protein [Saccharopolyspora spinosa]